MKLYITRHGETPMNAAHRVCGLTNIDLTEKGRRLYENEIRVRIEKINSDALRDFSEAERQEFERYLRRMYRNLTGMPLD